MRQINRMWGAWLLVCALMLGLLPGEARAAVTWEKVGKSLWLNAASGLDLATGGAGEDLFLKGTTVTSKGGMAVVAGATSLNSLLVPPSGGYSTSLDVTAAENKVLVIKLDGGRYAQVDLGFGWRSGMGFSSLQIDGWMLSAAAVEPPPEQPTQPTQPTKPTEPTQPTQPTPPKPTEPTEPEPAPETTSSDEVFWGDYAQKGQLRPGRGLDLENGNAGADLQMTGDKISAPKGLALVTPGLPEADHLSKLTFTNDLAIAGSEGKTLLVRFGRDRFAWVSIDMLWRAGSSYSGVDLHWTLGVPMGLPESHLSAPTYQPAKSPTADRLESITPGLVGSLGSRTAIWTGTYAYAWTDGGTYRFDPASGQLTGLEFANTGDSKSDWIYSLDAVTSAWTGTYAYTIYSSGTNDHYIVRYDPSQNQATVMGALLPNAYHSTSVWDGSYMYIFGVRDKLKGDQDSDRNRLILRYDPSTDTLKSMTATMPAYTDYRAPFLSSAWDGKYAYIFGADSGAILRYDPATDTIKRMGAVLPGKLSGASAFYDGKNIHLLGGQSGWSATKAIYQYTPATDTIRTMSATLPKAQLNGAVVWIGDGALIFGGWDYSTGHREMLRYSTGNVDQSMVPARKPTQTGATALSANRKNGKAELTWSAFATPNDGYYVFRGTAPGQYDPVPLHDFPVLTESFTDERVQSNQRYYYVVKAYRNGEYVVSSTEAELTDSTTLKP